MACTLADVVVRRLPDILATGSWLPAA